MKTGIRVLITGGAGFIGANLCRLALCRGIEPVVVDDLSAGVCCVPDTVERHSLSSSQVADDPGLLRTVDAIVHLAGKPSVQFANENPVEALEANVTDTLRLLLAASRAGVRRFVFASSNASVGTVDGAVHEAVTPRPVSFYGASKLGAEAYCLAAASFLSLEPVILRFANVYGPLSDHKPSVVHKFARAALEDQPIRIFGDGCQTRDFVFVEDVCSAIVQAVRRPYLRSTYQIGSGAATSVLGLVDLLEKALGRPVRREFAAARPGDVMHSVSDIRLARELLEWEPEVSLGEGLSRTIEYYRECYRQCCRPAPAPDRAPVE